MNKLYSFRLFVFLSLFFFACDKVPSDITGYFPEVRTVSTVLQSDGSVKVTGEVVSSGYGAMEYVGFCLSDTGVPEMLDNQVISGLEGNLFTATYVGFDINKTYYFRAWGVNNNGYSYGNVLSMANIHSEPVEAPCTPPNNTLNTGVHGNEDIYSVDPPVNNGDSWHIFLSTSFTTMDLVFGGSLHNGIYTTIHGDTPGPGQVTADFTVGMTNGFLKPGNKIYVNDVSPGHWKVTICNAPWQFNSSTTAYVTSAFLTP